MRYLVGTILLGVSGALCIPAQHLLSKSYRKTTQWKTARGIVVGAETELGVDSQTTFYPVVEFRCPDGRKYSFRASAGSGRHPSTGKTVKLIYDPEEPTTADLVWNLWFGPSVLLILGVFFLLFALLTYAGCMVD